MSRRWHTSTGRTNRSAVLDRPVGDPGAGPNDGGTERRRAAGQVALGFALSFVIGLERELRGSPAGGRTFAVVGAGAAGITAVAYLTSPQAVAGVSTGIGFIGGGVVFHREGGMVRGVTTRRPSSPGPPSAWSWATAISG